MPHVKIYDAQHFKDFKVSPELRMNLEANEVFVFDCALKSTFRYEFMHFHLKTAVHMDTSPMRVCLDIREDDFKALILNSDFCDFLETLEAYNSTSAIPDSIIELEAVRQGDMELITQRN